MICGKWLGIKEAVTKEVGNIKSGDLYVPLEVFWLKDRVACRYCKCS